MSVVSLTMTWKFTSQTLLFCLPGQDDQPELPEAVQSRSSHQAAAAGLHHPYPAVDFRSVLQGE